MLVNMNFSLAKMFYQKKNLLEKAATMKRFEYSSLGKKSKAQTDIPKKQYQKLNSIYECDKIIKKERPAFKNYNNSNLIYNADHSFYKYYCDSKKINNFSFKSKYSFLDKFCKDLNKFNKLKTQKEKKMCMIQPQNYLMNC